MLIYNIYRYAIPLYFGLIRLAAFFRSDAARWVKGRRENRQLLAAWKKERPHARWCWVHCSSLGEFEQGRPVIEMIKQRHAEWKVCLSFFSPSGFEPARHYRYADLVCYFPGDGLSDVQKFLDLLRPKWALFVKYDFWWNTLNELNVRRIPFVFISAIFRKDHYIFSAWAKDFRGILAEADRIFTQDHSSFERLTTAIKNVRATVSGDTRIDRVLAVSKNTDRVAWLRQWKANKKLCIAGSIWPSDLAIIKAWIAFCQRGGWKLLLVPHKVDDKHIAFWKQKASTVLPVYSDPSEDWQSYDAMLFDRMGALSQLYVEADAAYIGGGFGQSVHNILEPMAFGLPLSFGPKHSKFPEAEDAIRAGFAFEIGSPENLLLFFEKIEQVEFLTYCRARALDYLQQHMGSSQQIYNYLCNRFLQGPPPSNQSKLTDE